MNRRRKAYFQKPKKEIIKKVRKKLIVELSIKPVIKLKKYKKRQRWDAILDRLPKNINLVGAEIGVLNGNTAHRILLARPLLKHIMIDPWAVPLAGSSYSKSGKAGDTNASKSGNEHEKAYQRTKGLVAFAGKRAVIMRMMSHEAVKKIEDNSLDFCFIDGDHSYEGTKLDIDLWLLKVKEGGWIGGHDYKHETRPDLHGVDKAVEEVFEKKDIETDDNHTWFVKL